MNGFDLKFTGFELNITRYFLNKTGFVKKNYIFNKN